MRFVSSMFPAKIVYQRSIKVILSRDQLDFLKIITYLFENKWIELKSQSKKN